MTKKQKTELRDNLIRCRRAYAERGAKLIEVTHLDGTKSGIANPKAVKAAMDWSPVLPVRVAMADRVVFIEPT